VDIIIRLYSLVGVTTTMIESLIRARPRLIADLPLFLLLLLPLLPIQHVSKII
jgi:hypothetical protein